MKERQPHFEWRAEHDLSRISEDAECFQLGEVIICLWDGTGSPRSFRVVREATLDAGAAHHATCALKAVDVVLARAALPHGAL